MKKIVFGVLTATVILIIFGFVYEKDELKVRRGGQAPGAAFPLTIGQGAREKVIWLGIGVGF